MSFEFCSGCKACENICPKNCIVVQEKKYGFNIVKNQKKCIQCGLCDKVCPQKNGQNLRSSLKGYNAFSKKNSILRRSSSGGIATELYYYCLKEQICCVGVNFIDNKLSYVYIDSFKKIINAAGSKYVFSDMNKIYKAIEKDLRESKKVLFIGLPCHVAALSNYCKCKSVNQEKLYLVDIVCHGINTRVLFKKHQRAIGIDLNKDNKYYFRKKTNPYGLEITHKGNTIYSKSRFRDEYMLMYTHNIVADSCVRCDFAQSKRIGDISIMDCSSAKDKRKYSEVENQSSVLINTEKGNEIWDECLKKRLLFYEYPKECICEEDARLSGVIEREKKQHIFKVLDRILGHSIAAKICWGLWINKNIS